MGKYIIFLVFLLVFSKANFAGVVEESITTDDQRLFIISRLYTDQEEAMQACKDIAATRSNGWIGCVLSDSGLSPTMVNINGGTFLDCITGSCDIAPNGWVYVNFLACRIGYKYVGSSDHCEKETVVSISGPSFTNALPLGPTLLQDITITDSRGENAPDSYYTVVRLISENNPTLYFEYTVKRGIPLTIKYVPPYFQRQKVTLEVRCTGCDNVASKDIDIMPVDLNESQMCRR